MKLRPVLLVAVLVSSAGLALLVRNHPAWIAQEEWFLDFLVANTRERFESEKLQPAENLVFIEFNEKDKAEYGAWPPAPIDYIMVLKKLRAHDPGVVAFSDLLKWPGADTQFVDELQHALVGFSQVALAFQATTGATLESGLVSEEKEVPSMAAVEGDSSAVPALSRLIFPDARLSRQMQLGFVATELDHPEQVPSLLLARADSRLVPSLAAQMIALQSRAPYISQRLRFGAGAGLYLGNERFIPMAADGTARPNLTGDFLRVNALELQTPDLGDAAAKVLAEKLGKNKLIVVGVSPSPGETHVRLAAWALALPQLKPAPDYVIWLAAFIAALCALWQLRFSRWGALVFGVCAVALLLGSTLVIFQTWLVWWPPMLPVLLLLAGSVFCVAWPRKS
ncbi:MAG TPA: CHASE2 domain-containing protein [Verrucomicrobiaceae bacterium]|jgi:CHASE2 domain-containing sensor protein